MKKNAINWKRTWCGSCLEFACPMVLMLILVYARTAITTTTTSNIELYNLQAPLYPAATIDPVSKQWNITKASVNQTAAQLYDFMAYTQNFAANTTTKTYNIQADPSSPLNFMPQHCYQPQKGYNSPLIAVVTQGNQVEQDLVNQLKALFQTQSQVSNQPNQPIFPMSRNFTFKNFSSNEQLFAYIGDNNYGLQQMPAICFGFKVIKNSISDYELELFFNDLWPGFYTSLPSQQNDATKASNSAPLIKEYQYYMNEGYALIQNWAANAILKQATGNNNALIATTVIPFQSLPIVTDNYVRVLQGVLPFFFLLMYIPVLYRTVYRVVFEKVTRAKESMRMMGMGEFAYWFSWFSYFTIVNTILVTLCWGILMINSLPLNSGGFLWLFIWLYGESLFGLLLIIQSLFSAPRAAAITTTLVYFGTSILSVIVQQSGTSRASQIGVCVLFPTVTMILGIQPLVVNSLAGIPLTSSTINIQVNGFSVADAIWLFIIGGLIMYLIGIYLEYVLPKTYGKRRHPCFFLMCCCKKKDKSQSRIQQSLNDSNVQNLNLEDQNVLFETKYLNKDRYEPIQREIEHKENRNNVLRITDLRKTYDNGFQAVNGINLKMYSDQIFVLLGHNGAGKTTTISMLTGLYEQSEGFAELFGINMFNDMENVRQVMGVCPQHDILFELLTTEEHLSFFYDLKGANPNPKIKNAEIEKLMKDAGIYDKKNALAYQLSGGNKRKLSVAISLCGNSKFVLLDEPTSGMDLQARRQLWNMLKEYKMNRIILLTTHYMDEADILGDRIGIMSHGKITALGSSIFLKSKFGVGYNLTIVKNNSKPSSEIFEYAQQNLGINVKKQSEIQTEMILQIPLEYASKFAVFFQTFDLNLEKLGILSYGISISTLEEVFLKVGHIDDNLTPEQENQLVSPRQEMLTGQLQVDIERQYNTSTEQNQLKEFNMKDNVDNLDNSFSNNLKAVLYKRISNYKRNKKAIFYETFIPAILMVVGIGLSRIQPSLQSPSQIQNPSRLPLLQNLLINPSPVVPGDLPIQNLVKGLPNLNSSFNVQYSQWNSSVTCKNFWNLIFNYGVSNNTLPPYQYGAYEIYQANLTQQQYKFISFINTTSQDAAGLYPQFMYEAILKAATKNPNFNFKVRSTPYPPTEFVKSRVAVTSANTIVFISGIAFGLIITTVVSYLVVERIDGLKHLQVISGMQLKAYWIGNFIFDFLKIEFTVVITIILFYGFDLGYNAAWVTYLVLPFGILPFTYVSSFIFTADSAAQTFTMFFNFLILSIASTFIFLIRLFPTLQKQGDGLNLIFKLIPIYMVGSSVYCDTSCQSLSDERKQPTAQGQQLDPSVWGKGNNSLDIFAMFIHFGFWTVQLILIEKGFWKHFQFDRRAEISQEARQLDEDVAIEANRLQKNENKDIIQVQNFKKVYQTQSKQCCSSKSLVAVSNLSFGLQNGECFALLGVNGAGKSTTFKSLTCEVKPSQGTIKIAGLNIQEEFEKARKLIGYCPQPNLIFEEMSVEEHIIYFSLIKGIPQTHRKTLIEQVIRQLGLEIHRKKPAGTLSGGNKRKLCVALALIGNPPIIFLDEPSAGMDPESRRFMWSVVGQIAERKTSAIVLTTHSMDEAEALSTKMGIMVKGGIFKCFGSAQHIKNKFGTGYVIEIKVKTLQEDDLKKIEQIYMPEGVLNLQSTGFDQNIQEMIYKSIQGLDLQDSLRQIHGDIKLYQTIKDLSNIFGQVELLEKYGNYMIVRVARLDKTIGFTFGLVETLREQNDICEYSVSQTTLEQIFQNFADARFTENVIKFRTNDNKLSID